MTAPLLPPSALGAERAASVVMGRRVESIDAGRIAALWDWEGCPVDLLPWTAWGLDVDAWDSGWTEAVKRAQVRDAIPEHRGRGTLGAIKKRLDLLGAIYDLEEHAGVNHHRVTIRIRNPESLSVPLADLKAQVERVKRASVHLTWIEGASVAGRIRVAGGVAGAVVAQPLALVIA